MTWRPVGPTGLAGQSGVAAHATTYGLQLSPTPPRAASRRHCRASQAAPGDPPTPGMKPPNGVSQTPLQRSNCSDSHIAASTRWKGCFFLLNCSSVGLLLHPVWSGPVGWSAPGRWTEGAPTMVRVVLSPAPRRGGAGLGCLVAWRGRARAGSATGGGAGGPPSTAPTGQGGRAGRGGTPGPGRL